MDDVAEEEEEDWIARVCEVLGDQQQEQQRRAL